MGKIISDISTPLIFTFSVLSFSSLHYPFSFLWEEGGQRILAAWEASMAADGAHARRSPHPTLVLEGQLAPTAHARWRGAIRAADHAPARWST